MDQQGYYTRTDPRLGRRLRMAMFDMDSPAVGEALSRRAAGLCDELTLHWTGDAEAWLAVHELAEPDMKLDRPAFDRAFALPQEAARDDRASTLATAPEGQPSDRERVLNERQAFVQDSTGAPVATCTAWFPGKEFESMGSHDVGRVHWLAVVPAWQRRGVGTALLAATLLRMREQLGCRRCALATWSSKRGAIGMYRRLGFAPFAADAAESRAWGAIAASHAPSLASIGGGGGGGSGGDGDGNGALNGTWQRAGEGKCSVVLRAAAGAGRASVLPNRVVRLRKRKRGNAGAADATAAGSVGAAAAGAAAANAGAVAALAEDDRAADWARQELEAAFVHNVVRPLLGSRHTQCAVGPRVALRVPELQQLAAGAQACGDFCVLPGRGSTRACAVVLADAASATLPPPCSAPVVCVELKPKGGARSRSPFLSGPRALRWAVTAFRARHWKRCTLGLCAGEEAPWGSFTESDYEPEDFFAEAGDAGGGAPRLARALRALFRSPQNNLQVRIDAEHVFGMEPGDAGAAAARLQERLSRMWELPVVSSSAGSSTLLQLLHAILTVRCCALYYPRQTPRPRSCQGPALTSSLSRPRSRRRSPTFAPSSWRCSAGMKSTRPERPLRLNAPRSSPAHMAYVARAATMRPHLLSSASTSDRRGVCQSHRVFPKNAAHRWLRWTLFAAPRPAMLSAAQLLQQRWKILSTGAWHGAVQRSGWPHFRSMHALSSFERGCLV